MMTFHGKKSDLGADGMSLRQMWWGTPTIYTAPLFQRRYIWGLRQFDQLWSDIEDVLDGVVSSRFLGAVVLQDISRGLPGYPSEYLIIDGQQRLSSLYILLVAVADLARTLPGGQTLAEDIAVNSLVNSVPQAKGVPKIAPTLHDRAQFHAIVNRLAPVTMVSPAAGYGPLTGPMQAMYDKARLRIRRELISQKREQEAEEHMAPQAAYLERIHAVILDRLKIVGIRLGDDDDPHQVFDRLNSGGIKLKVSDLVRNEVFRRLASKPDEAIALSTGDWAHLEQSLGDRFDEFVFAYGLIRKPSTTKGSLLDDLRVEWGLSTPDSGLTAKEIIVDMSEYVPSFNLVAGPPIIQPAPAISPNLRGASDRCARLRRMPVPSSTFSFVTMLMKSAIDDKIPASDTERCLALLESFLVRRAFAGLEPTGLHAVFKTMWQDSAGNPTAFLDALAKHKTVSFPSDGQFEQDIRLRPVYGMKLLPYVLRVLDDATPGDRVAAGTPLTVDHVMPQHPGASWAVDKEDHRRLVDTWANLIPLSGPGNSKKGTATWAVARLQIPNESVWKTARVLASTHETWGVHEIEDRADRLVAFAIKEWPHEP